VDARIVEAQPLREQVANIIRRMIITGELAAGAPISERQISQTLGVSTTPVKEAFRMLESEGLMYAVARKGSFISDFPARGMLQLVFMRSALEGVAAYFAAQNATAEDIAAMEAALAASGRILERDCLGHELAESNDLFHRTLRRSARNDYLVGLLGNMNSVDQIIREVSPTTGQVEPHRAQKEHLAILEAIRARDCKRAEELMVAHVRRAGEFILESGATIVH
jgi:DNA-binding GntR family transcriptional regulator